MPEITITLNQKLDEPFWDEENIWICSWTMTIDGIVYGDCAFLGGPIDGVAEEECRKIFMAQAEKAIEDHELTYTTALSPLSLRHFDA